MIHHDAFIHPKAHVDRETVQIGAGTKVWQFASVSRETRIGEDCVIWPFAMLDGPVIGDRCKICSGVAMGNGFLIGNDVFIGPNVTLCNDMWPSTSDQGWSREEVNKDWSIIILDGASIGAGAVILPGVTIGAGAMVASGVIVERDVPTGMLIQRNGYLSTLPASRREARMRFVR